VRSRLPADYPPTTRHDVTSVASEATLLRCVIATPPGGALLALRSPSVSACTQDERNEYRNVTVERASRILDALGVHLRGEFE
jgi:hypothetical protein